MRVIAATILSLVAASACRAETTNYLTYETVTLPIDAKRVHDDPMTPYREFIARLRERAGDEARQDMHEPVVSSRPWGRQGQRLLISAITPEKGVFYVTEYGPYQPEAQPAGGGVVVSRLRDELNVCRFTIEWDKLPSGPYAPGLAWTSWAFPSVDCKPPASADVARLPEQRRQSETAIYRIEAAGSLAGIKAKVVREEWPLKAYGPKPPLDAGRAIQAAIGEGGKLVSVIPVSDDIPAYALTKGGGHLFALAEHFESWKQKICVVEGLGWADIAAGNAHPRAATARKLCKQLFEEGHKRYLEELKLSTTPITIAPIDRN